MAVVMMMVMVMIMVVTTAKQIDVMCAQLRFNPVVTPSVVNRLTGI